MNKKILFVFIGLLAIAMSATPVMAAPAERIAITVTLTNTANPPPEKVWGTNGEIVHMRGLLRTFDVVITIPGEDDLEGELAVIRTNNWNLKTAQHLWTGDTVLTLAGGTFEGRWKGVISNFNIMGPTGDGVLHCVLHGTGAFKGQTLKWAYVGPIPTGGIPQDGVLIRP